jgi:predicted nucleotidyltransferase
MPLTAEYVLSELEAHAEVLRGFGVKLIGIFGSVARGEAREDSDLDFLVDFTEWTTDAFFGLAFFLEDLFGRDIDLVPMRSIRAELRDAVLAEAVYAQRI